MRLTPLILSCAVACRPAETPSTPADVIGVWRQVAGPTASPSCDSATVEFRSNGTMLVRSGSQVLTATYTARSGARSARLEVVQTNLSFNDGLNCQGIPAAYVQQHYVNRFYVGVNHDTLRIYVRPTDRSSFLTTTRVR